MFNPAHVIPAACLVLAAAIQAVQTPTSGAVTTASGVYTAAQAKRGEQTYMNVCVACHPAGTYTTDAFRQKWNGAQLSDLFELVASTMPKQEPGSLTANDYADVVAYLLKINGAPTGKQELPADEQAMKKIRINMPRSK